MTAAEQSHPVVTPLGENVFAVDRFSGAGRSYRVDLQAKSCTCPHYTRRLAGTPGAECKHLQQVRKEQAWLIARSKAQRVPDAQMDALMERYANDMTIWSALWSEQQARAAAAVRDAELRELFG